MGMYYNYDGPVNTHSTRELNIGSAHTPEETKAYAYLHTAIIDQIDINNVYRPCMVDYAEHYM